METKNCPYCGEEVKLLAKKCKHCGEWFDENAENKNEKKEIVIKKIGNNLNYKLLITICWIAIAVEFFLGIYFGLKFFLWDFSSTQEFFGVIQGIRYLAFGALFTYILIGLRNYCVINSFNKGTYFKTFIGLIIGMYFIASIVSFFADSEPLYYSETEEILFGIIQLLIILPIIIFTIYFGYKLYQNIQTDKKVGIAFMTWAVVSCFMSVVLYFALEEMDADRITSFIDALLNIGLLFVLIKFFREQNANETKEVLQTED